MTPLRRAVEEYLALRRQLGVTLHETGRVLAAFAAYAEQERGVRHDRAGAPLGLTPHDHLTRDGQRARADDPTICAMAPADRCPYGNPARRPTPRPRSATSTASLS